MTMIKVDNDISQDRLQKTIDALDPQKPTVIWYGVSAANADTNYAHECKVIEDEVLKIQGLSKTEKLARVKDIRDLIVNLYTNVFETEHYQHGAHLESFIRSMSELHSKMQASALNLANFIFYDTSTLHRYNRNWVRDLATPELFTQQQILHKKRNDKTLEKFGISYDEACVLLTTPELQKRIHISFKDPSSGKSKKKIFYLFGSSWEEAYEILDTVHKKASNASNAAQMAQLRDTPSPLQPSDIWLLMELQQWKEWYKEAAQIFEKYGLFNNHWRDAYYLLRDLTIAAFPRDVLEEYNLAIWADLKTSQMEGIITAEPKNISDRFKEWEKWYIKTSELFQSSNDPNALNDPNDSEDSRGSKKSKKSKKSKRKSLNGKIIILIKNPNEGSYALQNADKALDKIAQETSWEVTAEEAVTASLQRAADVAYERFGKIWQEKHRLSIMQNTQQLQAARVNVDIQAWKDWYQTEQGKAYINEIEKHYHTDPSFREVVNEATLVRLKKVLKEDQQRSSTRHPVKTPDRKRPPHITIGEIDFTDIFHIEGIKYILEEVARVWYLLEEYRGYNIILTYPHWDPPPAVTYFLSSRGLLNNLNPKHTKSVPLQAHHIVYLGFNYPKPPNKAERQVLAAQLAASLGNLKYEEVFDKGKSKADIHDTTPSITTPQAVSLKKKESKPPLRLLPSDTTTTPSSSSTSELESLKKELKELRSFIREVMKDRRETQLEWAQTQLEIEQTMIEFRMGLEEFKARDNARDEVFTKVSQLIASLHTNSPNPSSLSQDRQSERMTGEALVKSVMRMLGPDATQEDVNRMLLNMPTAHSLSTAAPNTSSSQKHHIPYPSQLTPNATAANTAARNTPAGNTPTSPSYNLALRTVSSSPAPAEMTRAHAEAQGRTRYLPGTKHPAPPPITIPRTTPTIKIESKEDDRDFYGLASPGKRKPSPAFLGSFFGNKRRKESQQYQRDTNMSGLESDGMTVTGSSSGQASPPLMKPKR